MKQIKLSDIPRQDPFAVPEGYLQSLPQQIQHKLVQHNAPEASPNALMLLWVRYQMAFSLLMLLTVGLLLWQKPEGSKQPNVQALLQEASNQDVASYLNSHDQLSVQELSSISYLDLASQQRLNELPPPQAIEDEIFTDLDTYTVEELWK